MKKLVKKCSAKVSKKSKSCCCRNSKAQDKGIVEIYESIVNKINDIMEGYGMITDIFHVVRELSADDEVVGLIKKISGNKDPEMYVLLAAAILRVVKTEMEDGDGIFDYTPPA